MNEKKQNAINFKNDLKNPNPMALYMTMTYLNQQKNKIDNPAVFADTFAVYYCIFQSAISDYIENPDIINNLFNEVFK